MTREAQAKELLSSTRFIRGEIAIGIVVAHDDAIRRECANRAERKCYEYLALGVSNGSAFVNINELKRAILGTEPAREDIHSEIIGLKYYIDNPSAWDHFSQNVSDSIRNLVSIIDKEVKPAREES